METRASYFLVGLFVLVLAIGTVGFIIWLAGFDRQADTMRYRIIVDGSVTGLTEGSVVRYSGVPVGQVDSIALDPEVPGQVDVMIAVKPDTPVRTDTKVTLELQGLAGGLYVLMSGGTEGAPLLRPVPGEPPPVIRASPSSLSALLEDAPEITAAITTLINRATMLFSDRNVTNISETIHNLRELSDTLAGRRQEIDQIIVDASQTLENVNRASENFVGVSDSLKNDIANLIGSADATLVSIERLSSNLDKTLLNSEQEVRATLAEVRSTAESFASLGQELDAIAKENRPGISDFVNTGLYEFSAMLVEARVLIDNLNRISTEVERDPARFIFGDPQGGYETPPN